jgi:hypothetical protein
MEQLDCPSQDIWEQRQQWFEHCLEEAQHPLANYIVSDHATALLVELQACYCVGAWVSVVILSISIIDAQIRETEAGDGRIGTAKLLTEYYAGHDINWLRKLRNKYVHIDIDSPALTIDDQYMKRKEMEADATKAIKMVIRSFFQSPGV